MLTNNTNTMKPEQYFPSNGTEGETFMNKWCGSCRKDTIMRQPEGKTCCSILTGALAGKNPKQWIKINGHPQCTSFVHYQEVRKLHMKRAKKHQLKLDL